MTDSAAGRGGAEPIRKGDRVRYWPGIREGEGFQSVAESDETVLGRGIRIAADDATGQRVVYLRRTDRDRHMDAIALSHVERIGG